MSATNKYSAGELPDGWRRVVLQRNAAAARMNELLAEMGYAR